MTSGGNPTNEWRVLVNGTVFYDINFPGQMTYAQVMGEDADADNIAESHDATLTDFAKNGLTTAWRTGS